MKLLTPLMLILVAVLTSSCTEKDSSPTFSKWTKVRTNSMGTNIYIDFERIRKVDGYTYYWSLLDFPKPSPNDYLSVKTYKQADCKLFRVKTLRLSGYKDPMGNGIEKPFDTHDEEWDSPISGGPIANDLKKVCSK